MSMRLPELFPAELCTLAAGQFPEGDEDECRRNGDTCFALSEECAARAARLVALIAPLTASVQGDAGTQLAGQLGQLVDASKAQATHYKSLGLQWHDFATAIEFQKYVVAGTLAVVGAQLAWDAAMFSFGGALKMAADRAAAKVVILGGFRRMMARLMETGALRVAERKGLILATRGAVIGSAQGGLVNRWAQGKQVEDGFREKVDMDLVWTATAAGGVGGFAGGFVGHKLASRWVRPNVGVGRHMVDTLRLGGVGGLVGGVAGGVTGAAMTGGDISFGDLLHMGFSGLAGGFIGAAGASARAARGAATAVPPDVRFMGTTDEPTMNFTSEMAYGRQVWGETLARLSGEERDAVMALIPDSRNVVSQRGRNMVDALAGRRELTPEIRNDLALVDRALHRTPTPDAVMITVSMGRALFDVSPASVGMVQRAPGHMIGSFGSLPQPMSSRFHLELVLPEGTPALFLGELHPFSSMFPMVMTAPDISYRVDAVHDNGEDGHWSVRATVVPTDGEGHGPVSATADSAQRTARVEEPDDDFLNQFLNNDDLVELGDPTLPGRGDVGADDPRLQYMDEVQAKRDELTSRLRRDGWSEDRIADLRLAFSETYTKGLGYGRGRAEYAVTQRGEPGTRVLEVGVTDWHPGRPRPFDLNNPPDPNSESGRGAELVWNLSNENGVRVNDDGSKTVWFRIYEDRPTRYEQLTAQDAMPTATEVLNLIAAGADNRTAASLLEPMEGYYGPHRLGELEVDGDPNRARVRLTGTMFDDRQGVDVGNRITEIYLNSEGKLVADHVDVYLDEGARRGGFSKQLAQFEDRYYRRSGVELVHFQASGVNGGVVWSRNPNARWNTDPDELALTVVNLREHIDAAWADATPADRAKLDVLDARFEGPAENYPTPYEIVTLAGDNPTLGEAVMRGTNTWMTRTP